MASNRIETVVLGVVPVTYAAEKPDEKFKTSQCEELRSLIARAIVSTPKKLPLLISFNRIDHEHQPRFSSNPPKIRPPVNLDPAPYIQVRRDI